MDKASDTEPDRDCPLCPRLMKFRGEWREREPAWHNAPVPSWTCAGGHDEVRLLIVGLAPGVRGANRTGRPFTGDFAGDLLYATLAKYGLARGVYGSKPDDGLELCQTAITNAVRCVPPQNKPVGAEINACRPFLTATIGSIANLKAIVTLGKIAHDSTLRALGIRLAEAPFVHGAEYPANGFTILPSYHCSRYNTNTRRLTPEMFEAVISRAAQLAT